MFILYTSVDNSDKPYVVTNIDNATLIENAKSVIAPTNSNSLTTTTNSHNAFLVVDAVKKLVGNATSLHWLDDVVVVVRHRRSQTDDMSSNKTWFVKEDGYQKPAKDKALAGVSSRHHVPYQRIFNAWQAYCLGKTRREILVKVLASVKALGIHDETPDFINKIGDPWKKRTGYDVVVDWAVTSICFWKENMFYGTGTGDKSGKLVDVPTTPGLADKQKARVQQAAKKLAEVVPGLDITPDKEVPVAYLFDKEYSKRKGDLAWDMVDQQTIEDSRPTKQLKTEDPSLAADDSESDTEI